MSITLPEGDAAKQYGDVDIDLYNELIEIIRATNVLVRGAPTTVFKELDNVYTINPIIKEKKLLKAQLINVLCYEKTGVPDELEQFRQALTIRRNNFSDSWAADYPIKDMISTDRYIRAAQYKFACAVCKASRSEFVHQATSYSFDKFITDLGSGFHAETYAKCLESNKAALLKDIPADLLDQVMELSMDSRISKIEIKMKPKLIKSDYYEHTEFSLRNASDMSFQNRYQQTRCENAE